MGSSGKVEAYHGRKVGTDLVNLCSTEDLTLTVSSAKQLAIPPATVPSFRDDGVGCGAYVTIEKNVTYVGRFRLNVGPWISYVIVAECKYDV